MTWERQEEGTQRNVMLKTENKARTDVDGKPFPCPLCGVALPVRLSQKEKPYCVCNDCGIQLFIRGKAGIQRLQIMLQPLEPILEDFSSGSVVVSLYNRLEELKKRRNEFEAKQGIIFRDETLDDAIAALDGEIKGIESAIKKARKNAEREK
jgi:hypothetical protein